MLRILRAFAWLRWRMFINSLEKTSARDTVERFSLAIEKIGPIMAGVVLIPSALALAAAGAAGGFALARGDQHPLLFDAVRYLLLIVPIVSIFGPLFLPAADRTNPVRLLLMPIPRSTLYAAQTSSAFGDIWVLIMLPVVFSVPVGLLAGGALVAALIALTAGLLLLLIVIGLSSLATSLLHLVMRNRRRGELVALLFILIVPALSMLPGLLGAHHYTQVARDAPSVTTQRAIVWAVDAGERMFALYPSELYTNSTRVAAAGNLAPAVGGLAWLAVTGLLLHAIGLSVFARVLDSPGSDGTRRVVATRAAWGRTLPGLSPGASAVALAQVRLALRTPRGRSILLSPIVMVAIFAAFMHRPSAAFDVGPFALNGGLSLGTFGAFVCLMSILPIAMNQFAVDKAGLTLALLSPLTDREYLAGKAVGNGLIAMAPALVAVVVSFALFPRGSLALWISIPLGLLATYLLVAPVAAALSAAFPRVVDLNSIGRGSNAHGVSGSVGLVAFGLAGTPPLLISMAASIWLRQPSIAPLLLIVWCGITYVIGQLLFIPARRIFAARRENLAMIF
jgi:hypothetical protein